MRIGLVSDTHGVFDASLCQVFKGAALILHAGDVGHKGGHEGIWHSLQTIAPTHCVRGNVDETAPEDRFPTDRIDQFNGWTVLTTHICGFPPRKEVTDLAQQASADIVIFGHSHKYSVNQQHGTLYVNPGSAGPARFRLKRTVALLHLPSKESGNKPRVERIELAPKAPPRAKK